MNMLGISSAANTVTLLGSSLSELSMDILHSLRITLLLLHPQTSPFDILKPKLTSYLPTVPLLFLLFQINMQFPTPHRVKFRFFPLTSHSVHHPLSLINLMNFPSLYLMTFMFQPHLAPCSDFFSGMTWSGNRCLLIPMLHIQISVSLLTCTKCV